MNQTPSSYLKLILSLSLAWPAVGHAKGEKRTIGTLFAKPGHEQATKAPAATTPSVGETFQPTAEMRVPNFDGSLKAAPVYFTSEKSIDGGWEVYSVRDNHYVFGSWHDRKGVLWNGTTEFVTKNVAIPKPSKLDRLKLLYQRRVQSPHARQLAPLDKTAAATTAAAAPATNAPAGPAEALAPAPVAETPPAAPTGPAAPAVTGATPNIAETPGDVKPPKLAPPRKPPTATEAPLPQTDDLLAQAKVRADARRAERARMQALTAKAGNKPAADGANAAPKADAPPAPTEPAPPTSTTSGNVTKYPSKRAKVLAQREDGFTVSQPVRPAPADAPINVEAAKPSQWRELLKLDARSAKELGRRAARQGKRGIKGIYDLAMPESQPGNPALNMNSLPAASIAFAAALGGATAINVALSSGTHPIAYDQYYDQMHDEITWLSLSGMVITTNYFLTKPFFSPTSNAPLWQKSVGFGGILGAGLLVSTPLQAFANDPDVKACISFDNYHNTGNPFDNSRQFPAKERDYKACDRAFAKEHLRQIAQTAFVDQFLPTAATLIVSGGIYFALLAGTGKMLSTAKAFSKIGLAAGSATVPGAVLQLGISIGSQMLLLALIDKPLKWTFQQWANFRAAQFTYQSGLYAETPARAETALFTAWNSIKKKDWSDPSDVTNVKDVCYDEKRVGSKFVDCARRNEADLEGALAAYHLQQAKWRERKLDPVKQVYQQWKEKVTSYHQLFEYTETFYKDAVDKIVYTLAHPDAPANDPMVFNLENMKVNVHTPYVPDALRSAFLSLPFLSIKGFDGEYGTFFWKSRWQYVSTPDVNEFLIASLACGPEVEGAAVPSMLDRGVRFLQTWVYGGAPPQDMYVNAKGHKVVFNPPRITDPMSGGHSVCEYTRSAGPWASWLKKNVSNFEVRTAEKTYPDLFSYILAHVRGSVVAPDGTVDRNRLQWWWQNFVKRQDEVVNQQLAEEYQEVVEKMFDPAVLDNTYHWCGAHEATRGTKIEEYMRLLTRAGEACGTSSTHRLANGVLNNLRDQSRLYIAMMMDLYVSNPRVFGADPTKPESARAEAVLTAARALFQAYDRFSVEYARRTNPEAMKQGLRGMAQAYQAFLALVQPANAKPGFQSEWMNTLGNDLNESLAGLTAYVQLTSLPRVAAGQ